MATSQLDYKLDQAQRELGKFAEDPLANLRHGTRCSDLIKEIVRLNPTEIQRLRATLITTNLHDLFKLLSNGVEKEMQYQWCVTHRSPALIPSAKCDLKKGDKGMLTTNCDLRGLYHG